MRRHFALLLSVMVAGHVFAACTNTYTVRVHFFDCPVIQEVRVGTKDVILDKKIIEHIYSGQTTTPVDDSFPLTIGPNQCCFHGEMVQLPKSSDCVLEYRVSCDDREHAWSMKALPTTTDVKLQLAAVHPGGPPGSLFEEVCPATATPNAEGYTNLGTRDVVNVRLSRNGVMLVRFPVTNAGTPPRSKKDLEKAIDREMKDEQARRHGTSIPEEMIIAYRKHHLPENGVLVTKQ